MTATASACCGVYPYSLVYRVEPDGVLVIAVAHSSRSSSHWRGRA